jgi:hypothetical protein
LPTRMAALRVNQKHVRGATEARRLTCNLIFDSAASRKVKHFTAASLEIYRRAPEMCNHAHPASR